VIARAPSAPSGETRPGPVRASAPGRVNLIGEHTDYNDGFVLPVPIPQRTQVELTVSSGDLVRATSADQGAAGSYTLGSERIAKSWLDYVQGVTFVLRAAGHQLGGFDVHFTSQVPMGAGLSSSAALEIALLRALREAFDLPLSDLELAQLGRAAEVDFVGVPIGIMDQMASSLGKPGGALFIDTRTLQTRDVPLPEALELVVIASGVLHAHDGGEYKQRRSECEQAAAALGVPTLRDITLEELEQHRALEPLLLRRARHVVSENARVLETIEALARCDRTRLGQLFAASHASMRDDYEVSVPAIDRLVSLAGERPEIVAARLTGGGFGGSVVMLAERGQGLASARAITAEYSLQTALSPSVLLPLE